VSASRPLSDVLTQWANINSGSYHQAGLKRMLEVLCDAFADLPGYHELIECAGHAEFEAGSSFPRYALRIRREGKLAKKTVLLNGHYDTVYGPAHRFQTVRPCEEGRLCGPGVTDMKGGLLVMLEALKRWEASGQNESLSWEVLITPDEEIGSPFSIPLLKESAKRCDVGLVYESAYTDGGFVRSRMGSATYRIVAKGKAAHVGRNFNEGVNAITGLCRLTTDIDRMARRLGIIANVGRISGGDALNVVPEQAEAWLNVRSASMDRFRDFECQLGAFVEGYDAVSEEPGTFTWTGGINRPPKTVDAATQSLYDTVAECAERLGQPVSWRDTGGGSDGSNLAAYGLPNIDNLGVCGGAIHSDQEFVDLRSIEARIALSLETLNALSKQ
jgi:glutamate carboxypeptidase